jgi:ATPase subunit of ABC transporter with duplicated ATPase domains
MLSRFDITLLDEPTNDLDFEGLERLERLVLGLAGGTMIVSHDRAFLAATVNSVLEIDSHSREASLYHGGWAAYLQEKATIARHREESYLKYRQSREVLTGRAQRERQWATAGAARERRDPKDNDKAQRDFRVNRTEQLASRARRTEKALERLDEVEKPWDNWQLQYSVKLAPRAGAVVAMLKGAVVERGSFRLGPVDLVVEWAARVAVTGRNGSGKTTLVEALLGRLPLVAGTRSIGPSVVPGELGQERSDLLSAAGLSGAGLGGAGLSGAGPGGAGLSGAGPGRAGLSAARRADALPAAGLLSVFLSVTGLAVPEARALLAKFGLGAEHVSRPLATLSQGERTRAQLACFQATGVNFLVLDEPTNHLDMPAIEQLEMALGAYDGSLLIVSHDRRLLEGLRVTHRAEVAGGRVEVRPA